LARDDIADFGTYLAEERHASQNTICSYLRDVTQFSAYLREHQSCTLRQAGGVKENLLSTLAKWFKAQCILLSVTFVELLLGLLLIRQPYALLLAAIIAVIDALPVFGTGTFLLPWAVMCLLLLRLMKMGERQEEPFGRVYCYSVAAILLFHVLVNVGMTIGLMPVMGIPLPFMSYGGSSLLAFTILLFIAIRLDASTRQFPST